MKKKSGASPNTESVSPSFGFESSGMKTSRGISITLIIAVSLFAAACKGSNSGDQKLSRLETEIVRVEISDQKFDVPLRYMYGEAIEKWGSKHWPKAKEERVKVDYLNLSMLLPDMKPYFPEDDARWKVLGHGEKIRVSLGKPVGPANWLPSLIQRTEESAEKTQLYQKEADKYGLIYFASSAMGDMYFSQKGRRLAITCINNVKSVSPSCSVKSDYRDGLVLEYYYGQNYLPQWQQIDDKLKSLFDQFSVPIPTNSNK